MYWDSTIILLLPGLILGLWAQARVKSAYEKFSRVPTQGRLPAWQVVQYLLQKQGAGDVAVERTHGQLTDHYDPRSNTLRLSQGVYDSASVAALGIAAHEAGHAIQHAVGYFPLKLRSLSVPVANFGSWLSLPVVILGIALGRETLAQVGVFLFTFVVLFQLITLPVEFNASRRAMRAMENGAILSGEQLSGAGKVLRAAALTYVAALFSAVLQLLRLILIAGGSRRRD